MRNILLQVMTKTFLLKTMIAVVKSNRTSLYIHNLSSTHADGQGVDISVTVCLCVCLYGYGFLLRG